MVNSHISTRTYTLAEIEARLRSDGFNEEEANKVVTTLEPKLVTLKDAAEECALPVYRLRLWHARGLLKEHGRRRASARGGGLVLVDLADVREIADNPPKPGPRQR